MAHIVSPLTAGTLLAVGLVVTAPCAGASPSTDAVDAIDAHYQALGHAQANLGPPVSDVFEVPGGAERDYQGGAIFFSPATGARAIYGPVLERYHALGGPAGPLGFPVSDEVDAGNGVAHVADFGKPGGAAIYWSPQWGAVVVDGPVLAAYRASGGAIGPFSYPSADTATVDGVQTGTFIGPRGTRIAWSAASGVSTIPASLAATLPSTKNPGVQTVRRSQWWWIPAALAVGIVAAAMLRLVMRRLGVRPVAQTPQQRSDHSGALFTHGDTFSGPVPR